jgi:predicted transposase YbfD/YdcC
MNAWPDCRQIGMVEAICHTGKGEPSVQRRYFITSAQCDVKDFARAVRDHWRIENSLHWSLDVTFLEDACRVRKDHAAHNYATLRRFALNLIKLDTSLPKTSVRSRVKRAEWDEHYRTHILQITPLFRT